MATSDTTLQPAASLATNPPAPDLTGAVDAWLSSGFQWRFPGILQAQFDADTRRERCRSAGFTSLLGGAVALLMYPVLLAAVPDLHVLASALFLGIAIPFTLAASLLVLRDPAPLLREGLLALPAAANASILTYLFAKTTANATELYVAAIVLMLVFICVTVQVRFIVAAALSGYILAIYGLCFMFGRYGAGHHNRYLVAMTAAIGGYILLGNWRLHADQRRAYVLMLRERLRQLDLTLRNQLLDELVRLDPLTGLANRRAYDRWLDERWQDAEAYSVPLGLIMIDVDLFKSFNDLYGHPAGDVCLRAIATCVRQELRGISEFVARLGGEEFAVLLPGHALDSCANLAEKVRAAVQGMALRHTSPGASGVITISCGVASLIPGLDNTPDDLASLADTSLYRAKQSGRNIVCLAAADPRPRGQPHRAAAGLGQLRGMPAQHS